MDFIPCWSKQLSEDSRPDSIWKGERARFYTIPSEEQAADVICL